MFSNPYLYIVFVINVCNQIPVLDPLVVIWVHQKSLYWNPGLLSVDPKNWFQRKIRIMKAPDL
jgi:hypothetical protein